MSDEKIYIAQLASEVNRRESTVRSWCRSSKLPRGLRPKRDVPNGWRYWTRSQVEGIKQWMIAENMIPGGGLANFQPTDAQADELLAKLRRSREAA